MSEGIVCLVCGGRNFFGRAELFATLDRIHAERDIILIVHGAARGADALAEEWATDRGVPSSAYPADWAKHGRAAGIIRNAEMLTSGRPDLVVATVGGRGTADMLRRARAAGIEVVEVP